MAAALARGWAAGEGGPEAMLFCDLDVQRAGALAREVGGETRPALGALAAECDAVVLAVKPAALDEAAGELGDARAVISVLAATPLARLQEALGEVPVLRLMPNQPVEVRRGVVCYAAPAGLPGGLGQRLLELLRPLGRLVELEEGQMEAAMAVMSCSPAYLALVAEALARSGEREGLDAQLVAELVAEALAGTAELLGKRDPAAIKRAVAPPGGATEAGLAALERGRVVEAFTAAVDASLERFR